MAIRRTGDIHGILQLYPAAFIRLLLYGSFHTAAFIRLLWMLGFSPMISHFFSWGIFGVALMSLALVHYVRRQPSGYWIYIILFLGPPGALV